LAVDGLSAVGVLLGAKEIGAAGVPQLRSESDIQQLVRHASATIMMNAVAFGDATSRKQVRTFLLQARSRTSQVRVVGRLGMQRAADNWQKAPINSTILFMATVNLLFVIISLV
jgi:hypothetical protein